MTVRWILAVIHLLALGVGLGGVVARGLALRRPDDPGALNRAFIGDAFWGLSALLWISTGLFRLFGEYEKTLDYYLASSVFWVKMTLLTAILFLEIWPMITLIQWRSAQKDGGEIDLAPAGSISRISFLQALIVCLMVGAASAMARGLDF